MAMKLCVGGDNYVWKIQGMKEGNCENYFVTNLKIAKFYQ
jgi:hypothetical protein